MKKLLLILLLPCLLRADIQRVNEEIRLPYWRSHILSGDPNLLDVYFRVFIEELQATQDDMKSSINLGININDSEVRYFGSRDEEGEFSNGDWRIIKVSSDDFEIQKLISDSWTQISKWSESGGFEYLTTISDSSSSFDITSGTITGAVAITASGTITGATLTDGTATMTSGTVTGTTLTDGTFTTTGGTTSTSIFTASTSLTVTDSLVATSSAVTITPDATITRTNASGDVGLDIINLSGDADSSASILLKAGTQTGFTITKYGQAGTGGTLNHTLVFNNADGDIAWQSATDSIAGHYWVDADGGTNILEIDTVNELVIFPNLTASRIVGTGSSNELESVGDLTAWISGTADEIDITDDGDGTLTIGIIDPLIVGKGGTGLATITDGGLMLGSGTGAVTPLAQATNGQLPIGSTGADPVLAALTGTVNQITVTNGAGTITLALPQDIHTGASPTFAGLTTTAGRIVNTTRYTTTQTITSSDHHVACDTDGGAFTVTLPAGVAGTEYRIGNTGTSANNLTVAPDGSELLIGVNVNFTLFDGETLHIVYEATEGWF